jgi:hypothetical protein
MGKRSEHMKAGGREMLPVKLSEQMGIWLQLQSFPMPNGQYHVIHELSGQILLPQNKE